MDDDQIVKIARSVCKPNSPTTLNPYLSVFVEVASSYENLTEDIVREAAVEVANSGCPWFKRDAVRRTTLAMDRLT